MCPLLGTFGAASVNGVRRQLTAAPPPPYDGPTPEYWWRADSGLTTSGWTAFAGGINFTFSNVTSADSTTGVFFNGSNGFGISSTLSANIDAKHIMMRFDDLVKPSGTLVALNGGTAGDIHQAPAYFNSGGFFWYFIEIPTFGGNLSYAARGTSNDGTTALWADFTNSTSIEVYFDNETTSNEHPTYLGSYTNRMRWVSDTQIYLGRRQQGNYSQYYLKEFAIFTTSLSVSNAQGFRNWMNARWP
jgi:hypothetical protein